MCWIEKRPRLDSGQSELIPELGPICGIRGQDGVHPPGMLGTDELFVKGQRQTCEAIIIPTRDLPFPAQNLSRIFELRNADSGANVRHAIIIANGVMPVFTRRL